MAGSYDSAGSPTGFVKTISGTASTNCNNGFSSVTFKVTGPSSYTKSFGISPPGNNGTYNFNANWDTSDLRNGVYTVRLDVREADDTLLNSCGQSGSGYVTAKLSNPPAAPAWEGSPTAKSDGSANVTLSWKKGAEPDLVEYHIFRAGPDGTKEAIVSATNPGASGCTLSNNTYTCTDPAANFPAAYDGNYSYAIKALRERPAYNSSEDPQLACDTGSKDPCVASAGSDVRQVTLTAPAPSPSPTPTNPGGGSTPTPGSSPTTGVRGLTGTGASRGGTSVLSFGGSSGGGSSFNDFYSGTYDENLPYQPKTLIVGDGTSTPGPQVEAAALNDSPPNYRTIMLPVAGGLLAFLSAAHVRRLLVHF